MKTSSIIKTILIIIVVIAIAAVIYNVFLKSGAQPTGTLSSSAVPVVAPISGSATNTLVGQELLSTLLNLKTIKLNDQIFQNPAFTSLRDFTITLNGNVTEGRVNPFAPIGNDQAIFGQNGETQAVATVTVSNLTKNSATLNATISGNTNSFSGWFDWGTVGQTPLTTTTPVAFAGTVTSFSTTIFGLVPNTSYTFKSNVKIGDVTLSGSSVAFKTPTQ